MSEVAEIEKQVVKKEREPLFQRKNKKLITDPLNDNNPVTIQVLGICSALAVTVQMEPSVVMCVSVLFCTSICKCFNFFNKNLIPNRIRIIVQLVVVAALLLL